MPRQESWKGLLAGEIPPRKRVAKTCYVDRVRDDPSELTDEERRAASELAVEISRAARAGAPFPITGLSQAGQWQVLTLARRVLELERAARDEESSCDR